MALRGGGVLKSCCRSIGSIFEAAMSLPKSATETPTRRSLKPSGPAGRPACDLFFQGPHAAALVDFLVPAEGNCELTRRGNGSELASDSIWRSQDLSAGSISEIRAAPPAIAVQSMLSNAADNVIG